MITTALNHVEQMRNNACGHERFAFGIEIHAPGIASAVREHFELVSQWMVTPHACIDRCTIFFCCSRFANIRVREDAMATVEPTVRSPDKRVQRFVRILESPTVEQNLWPAIRFVVAVSIRNEHQVGCCSDPHATKANFQSADQVQPLSKDLSRVQSTVAIGVFKNQNSISASITLGALWVFVSFRNPSATAVIERHRNRLFYIGLGSRDRYTKSFWQFHRCRRRHCIQTTMRIIIRHQRHASRCQFGRPFLMQSELIKVDMPPPILALINQSNLQLLVQHTL